MSFRLRIDVTIGDKDAGCRKWYLILWVQVDSQDVPQGEYDLQSAREIFICAAWTSDDLSSISVSSLHVSTC
jgi:hypothetical protein